MRKDVFLDGLVISRRFYSFQGNRKYIIIVDSQYATIFVFPGVGGQWPTVAQERVLNVKPREYIRF